MQIKKFSLKFDHIFANDGRSTFMFASTSDSIHESVGDPGLPFVAWGAGINKPTLLSNSSMDNATRGMDLSANSVKWRDIHRIDIAPLISFLLGTPIPVHSMGRLPLDFINFKRPIDRPRALFINAKQLLNHFHQLEQIVSKNRIFFKPYPFFSTNGSRIADLSEFYDKNIYASLNEKGGFAEEEAIQSLLEQLFYGLKDLYTYEWPQLRIVVFVGHLGWFLFSVIHLLWLSSIYADEKKQLEQPSYRRCIMPLAVCIGITFIYLLFKRSPLSYYFYYCFLLGFWVFNISHYKYAAVKISPILKHENFTKLLGVLLFQMGVVLVFYERWVLSLMLLGLTFLYSNPFYFMQIDPMYHAPSDFDAKYLINRSNISSKRIRLAFLSKFWILCSILFSMFPIFPTDTRVNFFLYYSGLVSMFIISICLILYLSSRTRSITWSKYMIRFLGFMVCHI